MTPEQYDEWGRFCRAKARLEAVRRHGADAAGMTAAEIIEARQIVSRGFDRTKIKTWRIERPSPSGYRL